MRYSMTLTLVCPICIISLVIVVYWVKKLDVVKKIITVIAIAGFVYEVSAQEIILENCGSLIIYFINASYKKCLLMSSFSIRVYFSWPNR
jgi:hypothetical protein